MGESKRKLVKSQEMLTSCTGVQTAGGRVQEKWSRKTEQRYKWELRV